MRVNLTRVTSPPNSTPRRFPSHLLLTLILYFLFIFYLPRCTLPDFPCSSQACLPFCYLVVIEQRASGIPQLDINKRRPDQNNCYQRLASLGIIGVKLRPKGPPSTPQYGSTVKMFERMFLNWSPSCTSDCREFFQCANMSLLPPAISRGYFPPCYKQGSFA